jgi:hypothetical protein
MVTAIVLLCSIHVTDVCTYMTYPDMLDNTQECRQLIEVYNKQGKFDININNQPFVLKDYMCIDWNFKSA